MLGTAKPRSKEAHTLKKYFCQLEGRSFQDLFEEFAKETIEIMRQRFDLQDETRENKGKPIQNLDTFTEEGHGR